MRRHRALALAGAMAAGFALLSAGAAAASDCAVPAELLEVSPNLPHLAKLLHDKDAVTIVAIGGGSTRGAAAGAPDLAYPSRLQVALSALYPGRAITVVNKGVPRQSAQEMVARFRQDVFAQQPALVVWETGIADAVRGADIDDFAAALENGIDAVKQRGIDILLVDMQFSRKASTVINFEQYLKAVHRVGELNDVYVFPRFEIMRYWSEQNVFDFDEVAEGERARFAARVYDCIARQLARAIRMAVE